MITAKRAAIRALCILCAAETAAIIAYYGATVLRMALAALIGLTIVTGMVSALRAARRGDLLHDHRRGTVPPQPAKVYYLPQASDRGPGDADRADHTRRVIRLYER